MENHPISENFPMLSSDELVGLAADIKEHGLQTPIVLFEGKVLDGRNRWLACEQAGVDPTFEQFNGLDPVAFVYSANLHRRHLSTRERARIAAGLATRERGRPKKEANASISIEAAARLMNVDRQTVVRAKRELSAEAAPKNLKLTNAEKVDNYPSRKESYVRKIEAKEAAKPVAERVHIRRLMVQLECLDRAELKFIKLWLEKKP